MVHLTKILTMTVSSLSKILLTNPTTQAEPKLLTKISFSIDSEMASTPSEPLKENLKRTTEPIYCPAYSKKAEFELIKIGISNYLQKLFFITFFLSNCIVNLIFFL